MNADRNNPRPPTHNHRNAADHIRAERLPAEFEPQMLEVDRLLAHSARLDNHSAPADLAQRIYEMSASSLPGAATSTSNQPALRLVEADAPIVVTPHTQRYSFAAWSRLAIAAAVLLAAGIALWNTWPGTTITPHDNSVAMNPVAPNNNHTTPPVMRASIDLGDLNSLDAANPSSLDSFENQFAYLLDAGELRSYDDLNDDLLLLVQKLEM